MAHRTPQTRRSPVEIDWQRLLMSVLETPGQLMEAYRAFRRYSFHNTLLIMEQCLMRALAIGPIATYQEWQQKQRQVRKGEKALGMWRPIMLRSRHQSSDQQDNDEQTAPRQRPRFIWQHAWFVYSQTDTCQPSDETPSTDNGSTEALPWHSDQAVTTLQITRIPFAHYDGNVQGYATQHREVAISPLAQLPEKTLIHEIAHILLDHTGELRDLDPAIKEFEAEAVAMLCLASLGLPGVPYCRGYIQSWLSSTDSAIIAERCQRVITVANRILKAGEQQPEVAVETAA